MGLRFRRSWSVFPGIRFNLGLKSGSASFRTRGLHYTVGTSGSRITAGIPGTGLFWTQKLKSPFGSPPLRQGTQNQLPAAATAQPPQAQQQRTVAPPTGAGVQFPLPRPQTLSQFVGAQPPRLNRPQSISLPRGSNANSATQKPIQLGVSATSTRLAVPAWLVWAVIVVIVIGGLCFLSAMVGNLVR
jgi:Protein of unknown function (DUF4236)